jgi:hypothetical protein
MSEIPFERVVEIWYAAAGKNTGGILSWFQPPVTTVWREEVIRVAEVGELRFIGGDPGSRWEALTGGRYKVKDAAAAAGPQGDFLWSPSWRIVAIRDPENGERVIIDGNSRALELHRATQEGRIEPAAEVRIVVGDLDLVLVRISKAVSSLWR